MTPQEIAEHKQQWRQNAWSVFVDPDADVWTKVWCKRHVEKSSWSFDSVARPDDWHMVMFEYQSDLNKFTDDYNNELRVKI